MTATATDIMAMAVALFVMLLGLLGTVVPGLPGTPLILAAAVVHRLCRGEAGASGWVLGILGVVTVLSVALEFAASSLGARKLGATWRGMLGAALGAIVGLAWLPLGILLGPMVGAMALELMGGREWREAGKAGLGAWVGLVAGAVGKVACALGMIGLFVVHLLVRWIT